MRGFKIYIGFFIVVLLGYVAYEMITGPKVHWMITLDPNDKNPFGAYVLNERIADVFPEVESSYLTLSQVEGSGNMLVIANQLEIQGADLSRLFEVLENGGHVMLAANEFNRELKDTLKFESNRRFRMLSAAMLDSRHDTLQINEQSYKYPFELIENYLEVPDSSEWEIIAKTSNGPAAITGNFGTGRLTLVNAPLIFTNFGLLYNENHGASEDLLKLMPAKPLHYLQFYQLGKREASTPLRFFLRQPPLRWALYLSLFGIAVLLVVDSRRKQRLIPIVVPPKNSSVLYAKTLGGLYHREGNHGLAAQKIISHFLNAIREKYFVEIDFSDRFYEKLAGKMGKDKQTIKSTFEQIRKVKLSPNIREQDLIDLSKSIDKLS